MASGVNFSLPEETTAGYRLDYGKTKQAEKNWIPFTHEGGLYYVYTPIPHRVLKCEAGGSCENYAETSYAPLVRLTREHPSWEVRGSGQATLINDPEVTPNLPRPHYLALFHIFDKDTGRYAHFAYRFNG